MLRGELKRMIAEDDLRGVTSNPAILKKAITQSEDYDEALARWLADHPADARQAFFTLAVDDIREACDQMREVYEASDGVDGAGLAGGLARFGTRRRAYD